MPGKTPSQRRRTPTAAQAKLLAEAEESGALLLQGQGLSNLHILDKFDAISEVTEAGESGAVCSGTPAPDITQAHAGVSRAPFRPRTRHCRMPSASGWSAGIRNTGPAPAHFALP